MEPGFVLVRDGVELLWMLALPVLALVPLLLIAFLVMKVNRLERKLDDALGRLRALQGAPRP